ncbi:MULTISPECIES: hypothetical protein [unclassified Streptomyces]|uniref:hypothetical protein n=1 Tax=unclassified Streptomyces TaxID=2593676 RepID=UPI00114CEE9B|nr:MULTISPECIES: hypothetical protein [unclassified Streptomyces]MYS19363.1 hypothetical protein [Streptomyces sp. SID4948]
MHLQDIPSLWHLRMTNGGLAHIWADGYEEVDGSYVFDVLARVSLADQAHLAVTGAAPADPEGVCVTVARIPMNAVQDLHTAKIGTDLPYCACDQGQQSRDHEGMLEH